MVSETHSDGPLYTLKVDGKDDFSVLVTASGMQISAAPNWKLKGQFERSY